MTGLEILFVTSVLLVLVMWGWFVVQGFRTSKGWGYSLIFLFPITPFLFAYRFERKTRNAFFYFIGTLVLCAAIVLYAQFFTAGFFSNFADKVIGSVKSISFSSEPKPPKPLDLPKPTPIPEALPETPVQPAPPPKVEIKEAPRVQESRPRRKTISVDEARNYLGKKVIITTDTTVHKGKLMAVAVGEIQIKKSLGGGSIVMGVPKNKITKIEVY